jgi:amino-acid N-acetyltransferase
MTVNPANPAPKVFAAGQKDVPAITALLRAAELPHEDFADHLEHFIVARRGDEIVGAAGFELHGADALLRSLVVGPALRGSGLGGRLVDQLTAAALANGVERFYLLTTTAEAFFAKRGFKKVARETAPAAIARTKEFNSLCPVSAVCMTRNLKTAGAP